MTSGSAWLRRPAWLFLGLVVAQLLLGVGAFVGKFGFAPSGYVAVQNSQMQILFCTAHTVTGMLLFGTSVVLAVRVFRLDFLQRRRAGEVLEAPALADTGMKGAVS